MNGRTNIAGLSLLLVDSAVESVQQLLQNTHKHIQVAVIEHTKNGVETLLQWIQQFPDLQQVHILAHGAPGRLFLGNTQLSQDTLQSYSEALRHIRQRRSKAQSPLDLLLYSCNVAAGEAGAAFVESLHRLTGANVAASSVPVGNAALGGTWQLDTQTSAFPITLPFAAAAARRYPGLLTPVSISSIIASYENLPDNTSSYTANEVGNPDSAGTSNELYTHNFPVGTNNNLVISGFTAASSTYNLVQLVDEVKLRRIPNAQVSSAAGRQVFWYEIQNLNSTAKVLNLRPSRINTIEEALLGTVINRGVDNVFANQGDNNINNIERIDFIASGGLTAPTATSLNEIGFLLLERGGNDPLTIAAITAVDASGNPTDYGPLQTVPTTAWGASSFNLETAVLNDMGTGNNPGFSAKVNAQNIRGVFMSYSALGISAGQTFFGYSVFPNDVGTDLVGLSDASLTTSSASGQGGLDLVAGGGIFVKDGSNLAPTLNLDPFNITGGPNDANFAATFTGSAVNITAPNASGFDPNNSGADIETLTISVNAPNGSSEALIIGGIPFTLGTASSGTVTIGSTTFAVSVAVSGTTATLTITKNGGGDLSNAAVSALLQSLQYNNTASSPNPTPRVFSFVANDGVSNSNTVTSTVSVSSSNNSPVDGDENLTVAEDTPLTGNLLSNATDVDGDPLSITQFTIGSTTYNPGDTATIPGVGTLIINANGTFTFTPALNYNGPMPPVSYTVSDGNGGTDTSTLSITVTPVNDPPVDDDESITVNEDTPYVSSIGYLLQNATDVDGDSLTITNFQIAGNPTIFSAGSLAFIPGVGTVKVDTNGRLSFTPAANYNGTVPTITYTVSDGQGGTNTSTVSIVVTPVNDPPDDGNENLGVAEDTVATGNLLANAIDVDGDSLSVTQFTVAGDPTLYTASSSGTTVVIPGIGTLVIDSAGNFFFDPYPDYAGPVPTVTYTVSDGKGGTDTSTLNITVTPVNDPPVDGNETLSVAEDNSLTSNLLSNATDVDGDPLSITQFTIDSTTYTAGQTANIPGVGTLTINSDGTFTFTPVANYNGSVPAVTYTVSDGKGGTDTSTLSITVTKGGGNLPPNVDLDADNSSGASGRDYQTQFVKGFPVAIADSDLTISDPDSTILQQAVITLVNRPDGALESLSIRGALPPGITASAYNPTTGQLILSGAASLAAYKQAIAAITYENTARSANPTNRTVTVVVSDGTSTSVPAMTTIQILNQSTPNGSSGADIVIGTDGDDVLNGFSDRDGLYGRAGNDILNGGSDPDILRGDEGDDILNGGTGNDDLDGGEGNDIINGGGGNDLIHGRAGDDLLNGGRGRDRIFGGTGRDTLNGGEGNDLLVGDEGDDIINGGRGNDRIIGGTGRDRLTGGQGNDRFIYRSKAEFGDTITDFEIVRDRIDLRAIFRGRGSMSNIRLRQVGADTQVDVQVGGQFATLGVLEAVNANTLQARHFIF